VLPEGAGTVESDILLAKLRPGQSIELEAHAVKGPSSRRDALKFMVRRGSWHSNARSS